MDAHARPAGPESLNGGAAADHPREPAEIRRDIEQTREQLGDTVAALAEKADVKARAKERVDGIRHTVSDRTGEMAGKVREAAPDSATGAAEQVRRTGREHPMALFVAAGLLAGFLLGRLSARR